jgi:hypothetical protein
MPGIVIGTTQGYAPDLWGRRAVVSTCMQDNPGIRAGPFEIGHVAVTYGGPARRIEPEEVVAERRVRAAVDQTLEAPHGLVADKRIDRNDREVWHA